MKSFIIHQINDWGKLKLLVKVLAEENHFQNELAKKEQIRFYVLISEVFQYQIIEYLPLTIGVLLEKIERESRELLPQEAPMYSLPSQTPCR
jgi:hypothetical protein